MAMMKTMTVLMTIAITMTFVAEVFGMVNLIMTVDDYDEVEDSHCMRSSIGFGVFLYHIISYHIISYHTISYHIISCDV